MAEPAAVASPPEPLPVLESDGDGVPSDKDKLAEVPLPAIASPTPVTGTDEPNHKGLHEAAATAKAQRMVLSNQEAKVKGVTDGIRQLKAELLERKARESGWRDNAPLPDPAYKMWQQQRAVAPMLPQGPE